MIPQIITRTGSGSSSSAVFDLFRDPFNVSIACVVSGTVNYTIQHTFDWDFTAMGIPAGVTWWGHDVSNLVAATDNQTGNFILPCTAAKILINSGTGSVTATFIQAGLKGG